MSEQDADGYRNVEVPVQGGGGTMGQIPLAAFAAGLIGCDVPHVWGGSRKWAKPPGRAKRKARRKMAKASRRRNRR